jgi:hypothetical protein
MFLGGHLADTESMRLPILHVVGTARPLPLTEKNKCRGPWACLKVPIYPGSMHILVASALLKHLLLNGNKGLSEHGDPTYPWYRLSWLAPSACQPARCRCRRPLLAIAAVHGFLSSSSISFLFLQSVLRLPQGFRSSGTHRRSTRTFRP